MYFGPCSLCAVFWKSCFYCNLPFSLPLDLCTRPHLGYMLSYQVLWQIQILGFFFVCLFVCFFKLLSLTLHLWLSSLAKVSTVSGHHKKGDPALKHTKQTCGPQAFLCVMRWLWCCQSCGSHMPHGSLET